MRRLLPLALAGLLASCLTPLHDAAGRGDVAEIQRLIAGGADPNVINESADRWTPMSSAIWKGQAAAVQALLEGGADPFFQTALGTPLQMAQRSGRRDIVAIIQNAIAARGGGPAPISAAYAAPAAQGLAGAMAGKMAAAQPQGRVGLALGTTKEGAIVVSSVIPGTSAADAGLQSGDKILAVGERSLQTLTLNQAVSLIAGPPGTTVSLTYQRGDAEPLMIQLTRQPIPAQTASSPYAPASQAAPKPSIVSDVDRAASSGAERPNDYALVIGIEEYQSLPKADFGARDAEAARKHLLALGIPQRNIVALVGSAATSSKLKSYLQEWLPLNVGPDATLWVYYSGHGAPDPKNGDAYLVPWDGDPKFLKSTAYPLRQFYADLSKTKAKRIVVALDSCFSGAGGRSVIASGTRPLVAKVDEAVPAERRLTVLAAASGDETTGTMAEEGHGAFTYYLLKGLSGAAKNGAGAVTPTSLFEYLKTRVQDEAHRQNREQTPVLLGASDKNFDLR